MRPLTSLIVLSLALFGCSGEDSARDNTPPPLAPLDEGPPESVYQLKQRTEIRIELASSDWDSLRYEGRSPGALNRGVVEDYEYGAYFATVTVAGVAYQNVEIKKKGFIGSLSALRPSLRLDFKRGEDLSRGLRRLTLNADVQDPSHVRECMAFELFSRAGIPASRCGLAHVTVNGKDLGTYSNVEPVREPMLRRHFSDGDGRLYEGTLADFDEATWEHIEAKNKAAENDRSDLRALVDALNEDDDALMAALEPLLDVAEFRDFWAVETLLGHWDGYAESANNYYLYHDPDTDRFVFLPWGVDQAFTGQRPFAASELYDPSTYVGAKLSRRLYAIPEQRELFRSRLAELTDALWDEPTLLERASAIAALAPDANADALAAHRDFLQEHGALVREALAQPPKPIDEIQPPPMTPLSCVASRPLHAQFEGKWNADAMLTGSLELDGEATTLDFDGAIGEAEDNPAQAVFTMYSPLSSDKGLLFLLFMPAELVQPGVQPLHALETFGVIGWTDADNLGSLGFVGDGAIHFDQAERREGGRVAGTVEGIFYQTWCLNPSSSDEP